MKNGFDVHGYKRRMELALEKLKQNRKVNLHNRYNGALLRIHGLETGKEFDRPKLSVTKCVRCEHQNPSIEKFCKHCGMPLDLKAALEQESVLDLREQELTKRIEKLEEHEDERRTAYDVLLNILHDPQGEEVVKRTSA